MPDDVTSTVYLLLRTADLDPAWSGPWPSADPPLAIQAWRVTDPALTKRSPSGQSLATERATFDTVVRIELPAGDLRPAPLAGPVVRAVSAILGPAPEAAHASVVVGRELVKIAGSGATAAAAFVRRRFDLSAGEMQRTWSEDHVRFARPVGAGYRQVHVDAAATAAASHQLGLVDLGFDGIALLLFATTASLAATRASAAVAVDATADESRFLDHTRSVFVSLQSIPGGQLADPPPPSALR